MSPGLTIALAYFITTASALILIVGWALYAEREKRSAPAVSCTRARAKLGFDLILYISILTVMILSQRAVVFSLG